MNIKPHNFWFGHRKIKLPQSLMISAAVALLFCVIHQTQRTVVLASRDSAISHSKVPRGGMSEQISVRAAGRGNPWISLTDGHDLLTAYAGEQRLVQAIERNDARPLSLASGDFDEDGVPDLVAGYQAPSGEGILVIHRGNPDAIYSSSVEAQKRRANGESGYAPFLSPALVFSVPAAVDFLAAGDFDGDGHCDVVAAERNGRFLHLMSGDGRGVVSLSRLIPVEGQVTAMITGEMNRRDGLDDVVVGVNGASGAKALVFEGPDGALNAKAEEIDLPRAATSMALGQLDDDYLIDLAIAAGRQLLIVHGRDRGLAPGSETSPDTQPAIVEMRTFAADIQSVAVGRFTGAIDDEIALLFKDGGVGVLNGSAAREKADRAQRETQAALLKPFDPKQPGRLFRGTPTPVEGEATASYQKSIRPIGSWTERVLTSTATPGSARLTVARLSSTPADNLLVSDDTSGEVTILVAGQKERKARLAFKSADLADLNDETIETKLDLRQGAVSVLPMRLNMDSLSDLVILKASSSRPSVIPSAPQQTFTVTTTADNGSNSSPTPGSLREKIILANSSAGPDAITFNITAGSGVRTISPLSPLPQITGPLTIDGYSQSGSARNNSATGDNAILLIELNGSSAGSANGLDIAAGICTVSGLIINRFTGAGINITTNGSNTIEGNFIGLNSNGTVKLRNQSDGIKVTTSSNRIGGTSAGLKNLISGNGGNGVYLSGSSASGNSIQGNQIGTDASGTLPLGNANDGVLLDSAPNVTIGASATSRNIIGGNAGNGIEFKQSAGGFLVQLNSIGISANNTINLGNQKDGIVIGRFSDNGTVRDVVVAFNTGAGIRKENSVTATLRPNVQLFSNTAGGLVFFSASSAVCTVGCIFGPPCIIPKAFGINSTTVTGNTVTVRGFLFDSARPNKAIVVDVWTGGLTSPGDQSFNSLPTFLGTAQVTTPDLSGNFTNADGLGIFTLAVPLPGTVSSGSYVNGQATSADAGSNSFGSSNFLQLNRGCSYTLTPPAAQIPAAGGPFSFQIQTQVGCPWNILFDCNAVVAPASGSGPRSSVNPITYTVFGNNLTTPRTLTFIVQGQPFKVTQAGATGGTNNCTPTTIVIGQTVPNASIDNTDCNSPNFAGHKADLYSFNGTAGQVVTINMDRVSGDVDPFLILSGPQGDLLTYNDDIDPGIRMNSEIVFQLRSSGIHKIEATTFETFQRGSYNLSLKEIICTRTPIIIGQTINADISDTDCNDSDGFKADLYTFNATAGQSIVITMNKRDTSSMDPYLFLIGPGGNVLTEDDDTPDSQNSRIDYTITSSGAYTIEASTYRSFQRGLYSLSLTSASTGAADFSLGFDQATVTGQIGTKAVITVNIIRTGGFTGEVTVTPAPKGGGIKPKPPDPVATTDSAATFKYKITGVADPGSRPLTFTGMDGNGRTRTATVTLNVVP